MTSPSGDTPTDISVIIERGYHGTRRLHAMFSSLTVRNYRLYIGGQVVSYTGSWMQRIAQDWLVLMITGNATDVGITTALQFLPIVLFGLPAGLVADRYPKRNSLVATQVAMSLGAASLAVLTLSGRVEVWQVYLIAFCVGIAGAFDNPIRQAFVNELVGGSQRRNAIALNSSVFQLGALVGPAVSGVLLTSVGAGWAFMLNACSYVPPIAVLLAMRRGEMYPPPEPSRNPDRLRQGFRFILNRNDVLWPIALVGAFGFFTVSMPVTLATFANATFHSGARGYAFLSLVLAAGSLLGALSSAYRLPRRLRGLAVAGVALCACQIIAAAAPNTLTLALALLPLGMATLMFYTAASAIVQLASPDAMRGRVMSVYLLVFIGCGATGGPCVGAIDQHLGPRMGLAIGCLASLFALCCVSGRLLHVLRAARSLG